MKKTNMVFNSVSISSRIIYLEYMFVNFGIYWIVKSFSYHPDILTNLSSADHPCEMTFSHPLAEMICLVEGFEGVNLGTGKVGDDELSKNEVCGARASSLKTKHENLALNLSSATPRHLLPETNWPILPVILQRIFPPIPWSKTGARFLVTRGSKRCVNLLHATSIRSLSRTQKLRRRVRYVGSLGLWGETFHQKAVSIQYDGTFFSL